MGREARRGNSELERAGSDVAERELAVVAGYDLPALGRSFTVKSYVGSDDYSSALVNHGADDGSGCLLGRRRLLRSPAKTERGPSSNDQRKHHEAGLEFAGHEYLTLSSPCFLNKSPRLRNQATTLTDAIGAVFAALITLAG